MLTPDDYDPTLEDSYRKQTAVDGVECVSPSHILFPFFGQNPPTFFAYSRCVLDIFDTAGQEAFSGTQTC